VQVDPIKPELKPPGIKLLKQKCDTLLSKFAFKFNLHRYSMAAALDVSGAMAAGAADGSADQGVYQAGPAHSCRTRH
jgi:hypothetical protein